MSDVRIRSLITNSCTYLSGGFNCTNIHKWMYNYFSSQSGRFHSNPSGELYLKHHNKTNGKWTYSLLALMPRRRWVSLRMICCRVADRCKETLMLGWPLNQRPVSSGHSPDGRNLCLRDWNLANAGSWSTASSTWLLKLASRETGHIFLQQNRIKTKGWRLVIQS